jgi:hypothetical protein
MTLTKNDESIQLRWIAGILEQIEFANREEVLPDYVIDVKIRRRWD